jgi:hypothetical protein
MESPAEALSKERRKWVGGGVYAKPQNNDAHATHADITMRLAASGRRSLSNVLAGANCCRLGCAASGSRSGAHTMWREEIDDNVSMGTDNGMDAKCTYRSLICLAIVKKACSTLVAFLADVSKNGMLSWSANSYVMIRAHQP